MRHAPPRPAAPSVAPPRTNQAKRTVASRKGAAAVEFALAAFPFFIIVIGIMEVAWQLATGAALDHAALKASRFGATGTNAIPSWQRGNTAANDLPSCRSEGITWLVTSATGGLIRAGQNLTVTNATWSNLGNVAGNGTQGAGNGGQIVSYTITYRQPFITGAIAALLWGGDSFAHSTTIVVKNEPFTNATC